MANVIYTRHALARMKRRGITRLDIRNGPATPLRDSRGRITGTVWVTGMTTNGRTLRVRLLTGGAERVITAAWPDGDGRPVHRRRGFARRLTLRFDHGTLVDFDRSGTVVGIEVLQPARGWPLDEVKARWLLGPATLATRKSGSSPRSGTRAPRAAKRQPRLWRPSPSIRSRYFAAVKNRQTRPEAPRPRGGGSRCGRRSCCRRADNTRSGRNLEAVRPVFGYWPPATGHSLSM